MPPALQFPNRNLLPGAATCQLPTWCWWLLIPIWFTCCTSLVPTHPHKIGFIQLLLEKPFIYTIKCLFQFWCIDLHESALAHFWGIKAMHLPWSPPQVCLRPGMPLDSNLQSTHFPMCLMLDDMLSVFVKKCYDLLWIHVPLSIMDWLVCQCVPSTF